MGEIFIFKQINTYSGSSNLCTTTSSDALNRIMGEFDTFLIMQYQPSDKTAFGYRGSFKPRINCGSIEISSQYLETDVDPKTVLARTMERVYIRIKSYVFYISGSVGERLSVRPCFNSRVKPVPKMFPWFNPRV